jgi:molecular chaperone GrpE (heat shock protein)
MTNQSGPRLPKWPFYLGNVILMAAALLIYLQAKPGMGHWQMILFVASGTIGALLAVVPFLVEYWAAVKLVETSGLVSTVDQIRHLELIAAQIGAATAQWQLVQEYSGASVTAAKQISEKMRVETTAFTEFLKKSNDDEKNNLRLEVEKLRRAEGDWLQIIMRMLDHTYAICRAAERSGQRGLIEQMGQFQNSCRDVARRIGLVPFAPAIDELFDPEWHQSAEAPAEVIPGAQVRDTIATGYTYQGRLLRPALVAVNDSTLAAPSVIAEPAGAAMGGKEPKAALLEQGLL